MRIVFPDNNQTERQYAAELLLPNLLLEVAFHNQPFTELQLQNGKQIYIEDHFFNNYPEKLRYLSQSAIPDKVDYAIKKEIPFLSEKDLPVLFGNNQIVVSESHIKLGIDLFAASFFCLTRWEEAVNPTRDIHGRFPAAASIAVKFGFLQRPIVDEMAVLLRNMIDFLGERLPSTNRNYQLNLTHDVDAYQLWPNWASFLKKMGGDVLKRWDFKEAAFNIESIWRTKIQGQPDPYDSFDHLMDLSEKHGQASHFYFLAGGNSKYDEGMEHKLKGTLPIMERIHARGHKIGVHPSYLSATDDRIFSKEIERFRSMSPQPVMHGRQHFLRFEVGKTWQLWEQNNLDNDSTLGYPELSGFRCGTCTPFPVFDIYKRKKLKLIESPLTAMDTTYASYQNATPEEMEADLMNLLSIVKKYQGCFTLLWHNTSFQVPKYSRFEKIYERFLAAATTA